MATLKNVYPKKIYARLLSTTFSSRQIILFPNDEGATNLVLSIRIGIKTGSRYYSTFSVR